MLRVVPPVRDPPPLPCVEHLGDAVARRPGELHEPLQLGATALSSAAAMARRAQLPLGLAVRLLVEAAFVHEDLASRGAAYEEKLDIAAAAAVVSRRLSAAEADYLRALQSRDVASTLPTLPVRLIGRLDTIHLAQTLTGNARRAALWETAALLEGRTMVEWALSVALRAADTPL